MNGVSEDNNQWEQLYLKISKDLFSHESQVQIDAIKLISNNPSPRFKDIILRKHEQIIEQNFAVLFMSAAAKVLKDEYFKLVVDYLRSPNAVIRSECILSIQLILNSTNRHKIIVTLINFLSDSDEIVVKNVIKVLTENYELDEITSILDKYINSDDKRRYLNALYLIERMQLENSSKILQKCFFHKDHEVSLAAKKLILRRKRSTAIKEVEQLSVSEKEDDLKDLIEAFHSNETRRIIDILQNFSTRGENPKIAGFLHKVLESECFGLDSFVLSTAVKALVDTSSDLVWPTLSKYLEHTDSRVIANTVEALSNQNEVKLIPFLEKFCNDMDVNNPSDVRIILSGISLLIANDSKVAMLAMKKFESGELDSKVIFSNYLEKWRQPPPELEKLVLRSLRKEITNEMLESYIAFINANGSPMAVSECKRITNKFNKIQQADSFINNLNFLLLEKFNISLSNKLQHFDFLVKHRSSVSKSFTTKNFGLASIVMLCFLGYSFYGSSSAKLVIKPGELVNSRNRTVGSSIKGRGIIININEANLMLHIKQGSIQYYLGFRNSSEFDKFSTGQSVKFVGELIDGNSNSVIHIRCKYIFPEGSYSETASS